MSIRFWIVDFMLLYFCGACGCGKTDVGVELELISVRVCFVYPHHVVVLVTCVLLSHNNTVLFMTHVVSPRHLSHHEHHHPPLLSHYTSIHQSSKQADIIRHSLSNSFLAFSISLYFCFCPQSFEKGATTNFRRT